MRLLYISLSLFLFNLYTAALFAQAGNVHSPDVNTPVALRENQLFKNDYTLKFTLTGRCTELFNNRKDNIVYHPMLLQYKRNDSSNVGIQIKMQTRGNFRRKRENCTLPPLLLNFPKTKVKNTVFEKQNKLKLVVPCKGDEYVIREWLIYKLYNLVTELSFKARLALVIFEDSLGKRKTETHYCIILEDEKSVAERNEAVTWNRTKVAMHKTDKDLFLKMAVFEFMIGNTDWSVPYLQNIKLITRDSTKLPYAIPYDFDHAGIVSAPYALPAAELELSSTLQRRYRGYCDPNKTHLNDVVTFFNRRKDDFYQVYNDCNLIDEKYKKFVRRYLDDFYKIINNDKSREYEFGHPCRQSTRVEIKGLKER